VTPTRFPEGPHPLFGTKVGGGIARAHGWGHGKGRRGVASDVFCWTFTVHSSLTLPNHIGKLLARTSFIVASPAWRHCHCCGAWCLLLPAEHASLRLLLLLVTASSAVIEILLCSIFTNAVCQKLLKFTKLEQTLSFIFIICTTRISNYY
jgi:hypothetical protein